MNVHYENNLSVFCITYVLQFSILPICSTLILYLLEICVLPTKIILNFVSANENCCATFVPSQYSYYVMLLSL